METIISYIDNIFRNYPDTPQVKAAREDLLGIMEDKYNELKAEGKSENEAVGVVISEFGNMDEIAAELGISPINAQEAQNTADTREQEKVSLEQAKEIIKNQKAFGLKIAIGVMLCILSPVTASVVDPLAEAGFISVNFADTVGALALFVMIAIAVATFIVSGVANQRYENLKKKQIILDYSTRQLLTEQYEANNRQFGSQVAIGVVLCILSVVPVILAEAFLENTTYAWLIDIIGASLFVLVACGVFLFITAGTHKDAYEVLLGTGEYVLEKVQQREKSVINIIGAIYWPVAVCIYLGWSFITMAWGITWIVWPIAGIIFGVIAAVVSIVEHTK